MGVRRKERLNTTLRFQVTESLKERLWRLCEERGLLPSQVLRQAMVSELERLEAKQDTNTREKGGEQQ